MAAPIEFGGAVPLQRQKSHTQSILFIQQEHAKTLQALHEEIQRLQKRCSELTFSVAMGTTSSPQEDFYREKSETLQKELDGKIKELKEATAVAEKKDKRIHSLEQQLRAQEKKYKDQLKDKEQHLHRLNVELNDKATVNADLMLKRLSQSQEGAAVFRLTKTGPQEPDLSASTPNPIVYDSSPREPANSPVPPMKMPIAPHPPREGSGNRVRRRTSPRAIPTEGEPLHSIKVRPQRVTSGRALRRPSDSEAVMPDPTPFLQREDNYVDNGVAYPAASTRVPLPPISHHNRTQTIPVSAAAAASIKVAPQHVTSEAFIARHKAIHRHKAAAAPGDHSSGSSSPEVESLAVDSVVKRNNKLRRAQEYNADYK